MSKKMYQAILFLIQILYVILWLDLYKNNSDIKIRLLYSGMIVVCGAVIKLLNGKK